MDVLAVSAETTDRLITAGTVLAGAIIGGLITVFVTWLQNRHARSERKAEAQVARRARAAAVLGRARTFLTDITPERIGINVDPQATPEQLQALKARLDTLRDELSVFAAADDDEAVMSRAAELEVALFNTFHWVSWHASDLLRHRDAMDSLRRAQQAHLRATTLIRIVLDLVRGRDVSELDAQLESIDGEDVPGEAAAQ
jgi:hypothetical protein